MSAAKERDRDWGRSGTGDCTVRGVGVWRMAVGVGLTGAARIGRFLGTAVSSCLWSATSGINLYPGQYWTCKHNMGLTFR